MKSKNILIGFLVGMAFVLLFGALASVAQIKEDANISVYASWWLGGMFGIIGSIIGVSASKADEEN